MDVSRTRGYAQYVSVVVDVDDIPDAYMPSKAITGYLGDFDEDSSG